MEIVSINPASAKRLHPELFCIMIYQSQLLARWPTQLLLNLACDIDSNSGLAATGLCNASTCDDVISASVCMPNCKTTLTQTNITGTHNTTQTLTCKKKRTYAY